MDYVDALNYFIFSNEQRIKAEKKNEEENRLRDLNILENQKREASAKASSRAMKEKLARQRLEREAAKLGRLAALKAAQLINKKEAPKEKKKLSDLTAGVGKTHISTCHHSREDFDMSINFIPTIGNHNNSMTVQVETVKNRVIMERYNFTPFIDPVKSVASPAISKKNIYSSTLSDDNSNARLLLEYSKSIPSPLRPETMTTLRADTCDKNVSSKWSATMQESFDALLRPNSIMKDNSTPNVSRIHRAGRVRPMSSGRSPQTGEYYKSFYNSIPEYSEDQIIEMVEKSYYFNPQTPLPATLFPNSIENSKGTRERFDSLGGSQDNPVEQKPHFLSIPDTLKEYDKELVYKRWDLSNSNKKEGIHLRSKKDKKVVRRSLENDHADIDFVRGDQSTIMSSRTFFLPHITLVDHH
jgi:hypothetical protein